MALLHTLRQFVERDLRDVIAWSGVLVSNPSSDHITALLEGKRGRYRIDVTSAYTKPPLGELVLREDGGPVLVTGSNQDGAWHQVAERIKAAEKGDAASSGLAEPKQSATVTLAVPAPAVIPLRPADPLAILSRSPLVYYIPAKGEHYAAGPALVTAENPDGTLDITTFPRDGESILRSRVRERGAEPNATHNCWTHYESGLAAEVDTLRQEVEELRATVTMLGEQVTAATAQTTPAKIKGHKVRAV